MVENCRLVQAVKARVAAGTMTKSRAETVEKSVAFNCNVDGLWFDDELLLHWSPLQCVTVDWVHNMLQDGTFSTEATVACFAEAVRPLVNM